MSGLSRVVLLGMSTMATGCAVCSYRNGLNAAERGPFLERTKAVSKAVFTAGAIPDFHTANHHVATVAGLGLPDSLTRDSLISNTHAHNVQDQAMRFYSGLGPKPEHLEKGRSHTTPVFAHDGSKGFTYAGTSARIYRADARNDVIGGVYFRCEKAIPFGMANAPIGSHKQIDVIVTGAKDKRACSEFSEQFLATARYLAQTTTMGVDENGQVPAFTHPAYEDIRPLPSTDSRR